MKRILLLILIFFSNIAFGQTQTYEVKLSFEYKVDRNVENNTTSNMTINLFYSDNTSEQVVYYRDIRDDTYQPPITIVTNTNRKPIRYQITGFVNFRSTSKADFNEFLDLNSGCQTQQRYTYYHSGFSNDQINFDYSAHPIVNLEQSTNTIIGYDDPFHAAVMTNSTGFDSSVYEWEYQVIGEGESLDVRNWSDMPIETTFGEKSFDIKPSSFLNADVIGKVLYLRVNPCGINEVYYYNPLFGNSEWRERINLKTIYYDIRSSAPHITSTISSKTTCFDSNDGSVKITFDRALRTTETLSITSSNNDFPSGNYTNLVASDFDANNSILIEELKEGTYPIEMIGFYNGFITYIGFPTHKTTFTIEKPTPVEFSITKQVDVWCHGGSDGVIEITASGGVAESDINAFYQYKIIDTNPTVNGDLSQDWTIFSNGNKHTITGLPKDTYKILVKDTNGCEAREIVNVNGEIALGNIIEEPIDIAQPNTPVSIDFVFSEQPTAYGFSNGRIRVQITGGTPLANGKYNYTWTHENGTTWTAFTDQVTTDGWFLTLENAIVGTYKLTVTDANHANATDKAGCTIANAEFTLNEPPLLQLILMETHAISCNNTNTFGDESSDGELTATATGGVPLQPSDNNGLDYYYTWKKKDTSGTYQVIAGETSNVLSNIDAGDYAVNIVDANGITVGTATGNVITPIDVLYTFNQPDLLQIALTKIDVFCHQANDGSINATITGGTGNYTISWSNGATTEDIDTLVAGTYTVDVTDDKGCQAQASITIDEPETPLEINYTAFFAPTFAGATNGWIEATVTGGTPLDIGAYTYIWEDANGANLNAQVTETINATSYVIKLNDLGAGIYNLTIEDKNHPLAINATNCAIIESPYELFEPEPLSASIELHTPISCNSTNTYGDPFSDGALEVIAEGGVQLQPTDNNGLPYYYTWKKATSPGVWIVLTTQTTNIATNLDAGNYAINIEDANGIILGVYQNNVLVNPTDVTYTFEEPPLLKLTIEKQDVYCFNGSDGWAKAIIMGGTPPYDILWSNADTTQKTSNLSQGVYDVDITDSRGCQVSGSVQINQPTEPLSVVYTAFATPSTGGAPDGWIEAQITGGTDFADGSYTYYWQDEAGVILNAQTTTSMVNGIFQIRLNDIPKGSYYLTIEDANFPLATTGDGCTALDDEFILYDPIEAVISVHTPISCHQDNTFNEPYFDGVLQVVVTGGLPFDTGEPYIYYWKKENASGGYDDLNQNSDIATGLSYGNYSLNVEDGRGVVIGVYQSLNLIEAIDETFYFKEPELLEVSLTKTEISCDAGNDATATVHVTGGIPPYDIAWSNGQSTETTTNLIAGNYLVYITDARGCQATGNITIEQPGGLTIDVVEQKHPTCFQGKDGKIELKLLGGIPPYTYSWNTGATTTTIDNLVQDTYTFTLMDANGCKAFKEIILKQPDEFAINLGTDRTLCKDQAFELDGSIPDPNATYQWISNNGFSATTPQISVSQAGIYQVTAISSLGCAASDDVVVTYSNAEIDSEFLLSSQAYVDQDVILFNVSAPIGDTSEWDIPNNVTIINQTNTSITLRFPEANTYEIGLISTKGDCYQEQYKSIVVEQSNGLPSPGNAETPFIEEFRLTPNPTTGQFEVYINLDEPSAIALRVFDIQGGFIFEQPSLQMAEEYTIPFHLNLSIGVYFVVLETAKETQIKRMIAM